jgi:molybdate transport system substrate-binding protein
MFKILISFLITTNFLIAQDIKIALCANLSYAFDDLKKEFKKTHPKSDIQITIGGSGKLTNQILYGASYDIFLSANMQYPKILWEKKIATTKPIVYAKGGLVVLSKEKRDFTRGLSILKDKNIVKIAVANPKTAPYGVATIQALKSSNLYENIKYKFVFSESVSQTVSYTLMATSIGIVASSAIHSPKLKNFKKNTNYINIDKKLYTPISQGVVLLKHSKDNKDALDFYNFILGKKAKNIFKKFGYL